VTCCDAALFGDEQHDFGDQQPSGTDWRRFRESIRLADLLCPFVPTQMTVVRTNCCDIFPHYVVTNLRRDVRHWDRLDYGEGRMR